MTTETKRDLDAIFGNVPNKPVVSQAPAPAHVEKPSGTEDQRKVAEIINNPSFQPPAQSTASAPASSDKTSLLDFKVPTTTEGEEKPWYASGTMPNLPVQAFSNLSTYGGSTQPTVTPQNPTYPLLQEELEGRKFVKGAGEEARRTLQEQHDFLQKQHEANVKRVNETFAEHTYANSMTPEAMYRKYLEEQQRLATEKAVPQIPATGTANVELKQAPLGGSGTYKYATEFGATPQEAMKVGSMSAMQKGNIPTQQMSIDVMRKLFPNMDLSHIEGYPFLLAGQSGLDYLKEKKLPEHLENVEKQRVAEENEKVKSHLHDRLAEHKAQTKVEYENAQRAMHESGAQLKAVRDQLKGATSPAEIRETAKQEKAIESVQKRIQEMERTAKPNLRGAGYDEYTNVYPATGAGNLTYAHELLKGLADPKLDEQSRALFQEELNKLQKTNPNLLPTIQKLYTP